MDRDPRLVMLATRNYLNKRKRQWHSTKALIHREILIKDYCVAKKEFYERQTSASQGKDQIPYERIEDYTKRRIEAQRNGNTGTPT